MSFCIWLCLLNLLIILEIHSEKEEYLDLCVLKVCSKCIAFTVNVLINNRGFSTTLPSTSLFFPQVLLAQECMHMKLLFNKLEFNNSLTRTVPVIFENKLKSHVIRPLSGNSLKASLPYLIYNNSLLFHALMADE